MKMQEKDKKTKTENPELLLLSEAYNKKDMAKVAEIVFPLIENKNPIICGKVIDILGEDIGNIKNEYGWSVAHILAAKGDNEVRKKIIELFGKEIENIKDEKGQSVADILFNNGDIDIKLKVNILLILNLINNNEKSFTERLLSNTINIYDYTSSFLKELNNLKISGKYREKANIPSVCNFFIEQTDLNKESKAKLAKLFNNDNEVEKIVIVRDLIYCNRFAKSDLNKIVSKKEGKELQKSLSVLPLITDLSKEGIVSIDEKSTILNSSDAEKELGRLLVKKVEDYFNIKVLNKEVFESMIKKPNFSNFIIDLFRFKTLYAKSAPNAHEVLVNIITVYFQFGINGEKGFKNFKLCGHELANPQLGGSSKNTEELKEKLKDIDNLSVTVRPTASSNKIGAIITEIQNYNAHKEEFLQEMEKAKEKVSKDLESIIENGLSEDLQKLIESRNIEGMTRKNFGIEELIKGRAINLIREENAIKFIKNKGDSIEELIKLIEGSIDKNNNLNDILKKENEENKNTKDIIENLKILGKIINNKKNNIGNSPASLALNNLLTALEYLEDAKNRDAKSIENDEIKASFTFDPSDILTFGRYGANGTGNCQNSNSPNADSNQDIMSMLGDSNQLMIKFTKPNSDEILGFLQVHIVQSSVGKILLLENPYTNNPSKSETMRKAAEELAIQAAQYIDMNIKVYSRNYNSDNKNIENITIKIPPSYVNRYIDFASSHIDDKAHTFKIKAKKVDVENESKKI